MKRCISCSEQYPDEATFCRHDGARLQAFESQAAETSPANHCTACGGTLQPFEKFCGDCGAENVGAAKSSTASKSSATPCNSCGELLNPEAKFCRKCGAENSGETDQRFWGGSDKGNYAQDQKWTTSGGRKPFLRSIKPTYMIGGAIAAALILLIALSAYLLKPSQRQIAQSLQIQKPDVPVPSTEVSPDSTAPSTSAPVTETAAPPPDPASPIEPQKENRGTDLPRTSDPAAKQLPPRSDLEKQRSASAKRSDAGAERHHRQPTGDPTASLPPFKEASVRGRVAEPGRYEIVRNTAARTAPSDTAEVVDQLNPGIRLTVTGSQGDWLVVYSKTRQKTVYVKRDDAMRTGDSSAAGLSARDSEQRWKEVENQIQQEIARRGINGVTVSFIRDTAYLRGTVENENQRFHAEISARSFPEVTHINNGIRVNR